MSEREWNGMEDAYGNGLEDGAHDAAQDLMDRLIRGGCHDEDWNGGDVVEIVDAWLQKQGVDTHATKCEFCGAAVAAAGFTAHWHEHLDGMDADEVVECPLCREMAEVSQVREHYRTEHPGDDPAADGLAEAGG